jgi:hypothetical protein
MTRNLLPTLAIFLATLAILLLPLFDVRTSSHPLAKIPPTNTPRAIAANVDRSIQKVKFVAQTEQINSKPITNVQSLGIYIYGIPRPDYAVWLINYRYDNRPFVAAIKTRRGMRRLK